MNLTGIAQKFKERPPREKAFASAAAAVLLLLMLDRAVFEPWMSHTKEVYHQIADLEASLEADYSLLSRREHVERKLAAYRQHFRFAKSSDQELAGLLREIENYGRDSGLALGEVRPLSTGDDGTYQDRSISITFEGTLQQWIRFVYLVQTSSALFHAEQVNLQHIEDSENKVSGSMRLRSVAVQVGQTGVASPAGPDDEG